MFAIGKKETHYHVLVITCIFWVIAKAMSWQVWLLNRPVPLMPVFEILKAIPAWVHVALFGVSVIGILGLVIKPGNWLLVTVLVSEILSCLLDQTRWQPWEYQYLFFILVFIIHFKKPQQLVTVIAFILCTIYFYSGLSKLNGGFIVVMWQETILQRFLHLPPYIVNNGFVKYAGYILPIIEIVGGIGLLFAKSRKTSAKLMVAMHVFILCLIGPLGINYNVIVWPWNVAMIALLFVLFLRKEIPYHFPVLLKKQNWLVFVCWAIMPAFSFFGLWDQYLSSHLYSGVSRNLLVVVEDVCDEDLPYSLELYMISDKFKLSKCREVFSVNKWYMDRVNVPCYPEERTYKALKKYLEEKYPDLHLQFYMKGRGVHKL